MVTTIKNKEEYNKIWGNSDYHGIGAFFSNDRLNNLKESKSFRRLKDIIRQIEDDGYKLYYYCEDDDVNNSCGKWLHFSIEGNNNKNITRRILKAMDNLDKNGIILETNYKDLTGYNIGVNYCILSGTASCCPYFGGN